ncbi:MAG: NYN domain-containing protein [Lachnospiraceae bacterium]
MKKKCLLVDGYNVLYGNKELKELMDKNAEGARGKLQDLLCNYQGFTKDEVIVVFDGYRNTNKTDTVLQYHNISVIYTKEDWTADSYIEKLNQTMAKEVLVRVVTSDFAQQKMILGQGATRVPVREFFEELKAMNQTIEKYHLSKLKKRNCLIDNLPKEAATMLGALRLKEDE